MTFGAALKNITFYVKYAVLLFGQLWWKIGLLFVLSSGPTGAYLSEFSLNLNVKLLLYLEPMS